MLLVGWGAAGGNASRLHRAGYTANTRIRFLQIKKGLINLCYSLIRMAIKLGVYSAVSRNNRGAEYTTPITSLIGGKLPAMLKSIAVYNVRSDGPQQQPTITY